MDKSGTLKIKKPNFLCIGAPRCGTNWLYENLRLHPEIFLATPKEIHFFNNEEHYKRGPEWYFSYFKNSGNKKIIGEMTPNYLSSYVFHRIKKLLGNPKIILMVRNPIDRIYSMYKLHVLRLALPYELNCYSRHGLAREFLRNGRYFDILSLYLSIFSKENIMIIFHEDIVSKPEKVLQETFRFLGVDDSFGSPYLHKKIYASPSIRPRFIPTLLLRLIYIVTHLICPDFHAYKETNLRIRKMLTDVAKIFPFLFKSFPEMDAKTRNELYAYYKNDIEKFSKLVKRDLSHWK